MKPTTCLVASLLCAALASPAWAFEGIRVTLLAPPAGASVQNSTTLIEAGDEIVLIDCGAGVAERLRKRGIAARDVTVIFLTDLEPRHVAGCREMWEAGKAGATMPGAPVWGPSGTRAFFERLDAELELAGAARSVGIDIADNILYQPEQVTVTAIPVGEAAAPRFGYRIDAYRRSVVVAGGGAFSESVARSARNTHVLLQELGAGEGGQAGGSSPEEAGKLFRAARPYLAVYMNVISDEATIEDLLRRTRRSYPGPVEIARDMLVIEVQNEVQVRGAPSPNN